MKPICAAFDKKTGLYDPPFVARHTGEAQREWAVVKKDPKTKFGLHPEDYELYHIANYNEQNGHIEKLQAFEQLGQAMIQYFPKKTALFITEEPITEQEHKDSCNVNLMLKNLRRGGDVRRRKLAPWGEQYTDDTTMDSVQFRIQKEELEKNLSKTAQSHEFSEQELNSIPDSVKSKFKFKLKKKVDPKDQNSTKKAVAKNDDDSNDDEKSTASTVPKEPSKSNPS